MEVKLPFVPTNTCKSSMSKYGDVDDTMVWAVDEGGKYACGRDYGGPLFDGNVGVGVTIWGHKCDEKGIPGVYTRVGKFTSWISGQDDMEVSFCVGIESGGKGLVGGMFPFLRKGLFLRFCRPLSSMRFVVLHIFSHAISTPRYIFRPFPILSQGLFIKSWTGSYIPQASPQISSTTPTPITQCKNLTASIPVYDESIKIYRIIMCADTAGTGKCRYPISRWITVKARILCKGSLNAYWGRTLAYQIINIWQ